MRWLFGAAILSALLISETAMAQTVAEKLACKGDFQKLCPGVKPGDGRPFACLAEQKEKLSPACAKVIAAHTK
jgi:hypothetical protein